MYIKYLKINEKDDWCLPDSIMKRIKAIWGVYFFDPGLRTYCCEMTPSYACHSLPSQVDFIDEIDENGFTEEERDMIEMEIMKGDSSCNDHVSYFHCYDIDSIHSFKLGWFPKGLNGVVRDWGYGTDFDYDKNDPSERDMEEQKYDYLIESVMEYESQSCV